MTRQFHFALVPASVALAALVGCSGDPAAAPKPATKVVTVPAAKAVDPEIAAALAKLPAADRTLAEAQGVCPITGEPLGSMGMPVKLVLKDQPVFLCCAGCKKKAEADPDKTLAAAKAKSGEGK